MSNLSNSDQNFVNPHFDLIRLWIQENIGKFIVVLLVLTYLGTGFVIGISLQKGLTVFGVALSWVAGMIVAIISQMIRGSLVYFSQANPYRIGGNAHQVGTAAALLLTGWACYEVIHMLSAVGVSSAFQISVVGFIVGGFFVEVFFLNELRQINHANLINDPDLYQQALDHEMKMAEVKIQAMEAKVKLVQARRTRLRQALTTPGASNATLGNSQPGHLDPETLKQIAEAEALVEGVNLHRVKIEPKFSTNGNGEH